MNHIYNNSNSRLMLCHYPSHPIHCKALSPINTR